MLSMLDESTAAGFGAEVTVQDAKKKKVVTHNYNYSDQRPVFSINALL